VFLAPSIGGMCVREADSRVWVAVFSALSTGGLGYRVGEPPEA
jgi:hypothetical protein